MKLSLAKLLAKVIPYYSRLFKDAGSYVHLSPDSLFCWIKNNGEIRESRSTICYGALSTNHWGSDLLAVGARLLFDVNHFSAVKGVPISKEEIETYITYVIERSPFNNAFLNKQARSVLKHKWMFTDVNQPANYMVSALVAIRYTHEFPNLVKAWNELVKVGVNEDLAFLIIHTCHYNPNTSRTVSFYNNVHGHTVFSSVLPFEQVKNFLNRKFVKEQPAYIVSGNYHGFDALWSKFYTLNYLAGAKGGIGDNSVLSLITSCALRHNKPSTSTNPFEKGGVGVATVLVEEFPKFILDNQEKIMEAVNNA